MRPAAPRWEPLREGCGYEGSGVAAPGQQVLHILGKRWTDLNDHDYQ